MNVVAAENAFPAAPKADKQNDSPVANSRDNTPKKKGKSSKSPSKNEDTPKRSSFGKLSRSSERKALRLSSPHRRSSQKVGSMNQDDAPSVSIKLKTITEAQGESTMHGQSSMMGPTDRIAAGINDYSKTSR